MAIRKAMCLAWAAAVAAIVFTPSSAAAQCGLASWYRGDGGRTSTGEPHTGNGFTAAHRNLPFGTMVRVRHKSNGREVTVRINDRGPFIESRIIDLSRAAAELLGIVGLASVCLTVVPTGEKEASAQTWKTEVVPLPAKRGNGWRASACEPINDRCK